MIYKHFRIEIVGNEVCESRYESFGVIFRKKGSVRTHEIRIDWSYHQVLDGTDMMVVSFMTNKAGMASNELASSWPKARRRTFFKEANIPLKMFVLGALQHGLVAALRDPDLHSDILREGEIQWREK